MSAFNNTSNFNNNPTDRVNNTERLSNDLGHGSNLKSGQNVHLNNGNNELNEHHGIAATGLNGPNPFATANTGTDMNYSGPIADTRKVDQTQNSGFNDLAGSHNPSNTNRHAGTGIPPVNTAEHAKINAANEGRPLGSEQNNEVTDLSGSRHDRTGLSSHQHGAAGLENPSNTHNATTSTTHAASTGNHPMTSTGSDVHVSHNHDSAPLGDHGASKHHAGVQGHPNDPMATGNKSHSLSQPHDNALGTSEVDNKPSAGDKIKGNLEKIAGKITGNEAKVVKGDNIAHGRSV